MKYASFRQNSQPAIIVNANRLLNSLYIAAFKSFRSVRLEELFLHLIKDNGENLQNDFRVYIYDTDSCSVCL